MSTSRAEDASSVPQNNPEAQGARPFESGRPSAAQSDRPKRGVEVRRLVVKVGSSTLTTASGGLDRPFITALAGALASVHQQGIQTVLVTSGAIAAGVDRLRIPRPSDVPHKQAAAAVGQGVLMACYAAAFEEHGVAAAQVLLSRGDIADRERYKNAHNTIKTLFQLGAIPIVNENDTVAVDEIRFGDNDQLAAIVALLVDADLALILSDVEGLYDSADPDRATIPVIPEVSSAVEALARPTNKGVGTGGMVTKLRAARMLTRAGIPLVVAHGRAPGAISDSLGRWNMRLATDTDAGVPGTLFLPAVRRLQGRKRWVAYAHQPRGSIVVNEAAHSALAQKGGSLLAAGITQVSGPFTPGDLVCILDSRGAELGRGLVNYSSEEVKVISGRQSHEIERLVGQGRAKEVIHRDNLVVGI